MTLKDLVLVGGGHAHVHVLKMLGMPQYRVWLQQEEIQVTLIARDLHTPYSGMLPGFVAGHYSFDEIHLDLAKLCRFSNIRLIHAAANKIFITDQGVRYVECSNHPPIRFDVLSINVGITPSSLWNDGSLPFESKASLPMIIPVKPIAQFHSYVERLRQTVLQELPLSSSSPPQTRCIAVVGGGAGGVELALSIQHSFRHLQPTNILRVILLTRGSTLLSQHNARVQSIFSKILQQRNISVYFHAEVLSVRYYSSVSPINLSKNHDTADTATMDSGNQNDNNTATVGKKELILSEESRKHHPQERIIVDDIVWCTQAEAPSWLSNASPLETTTIGNFIKVRNTYESISHPGVFAVGDCCHMVDHPRPKAGVFAVRAGPALLDNLQRYCSNKPLKPYVPQKTFLGIISTGDKYAVASKSWWFALAGYFMWYIKDYIDRQWMAQYTTALPDLTTILKESTTLSVAKGLSSPHFLMKSSECSVGGRKLSLETRRHLFNKLHHRQIERAAQSNLPKPSSPIIMEDEWNNRVLPVGNNGGGDNSNAIMTQTNMEYLSSLVSDPYMFGRIAAVNALGNIHAMGAQPQAATILNLVPMATNDAITQSNVFHVLCGVSDVLQDEGVKLMGGQCSESLELACILSFQGCKPHNGHLFHQHGGRCVAGDRIVVTKMIGTGALLLSDRRAMCRGEHLTEAIHSMTLSNVNASRIAATNFDVAVHACAKVSDAGLIGGILQLLERKQEHGGLSAMVHMDEILFLQGALEASRQGVHSSTRARNEGLCSEAIVNHEEISSAYPIECPLLFDPQTAGGLIFIIGENDADLFVKNLRETNTPVAIVGELIPSNYPTGPRPRIRIYGSKVASHLKQE